MKLADFKEIEGLVKARAYIARALDEIGEMGADLDPMNQPMRLIINGQDVSHKVLLAIRPAVEQEFAVALEKIDTSLRALGVEVPEEQQS